MSVDEQSQRNLLETNGWVPLELLGEGGGARVFKVISHQAINRVMEPLVTATVHNRDTSFAQAKILAHAIADFADGTEIVLAAGKVAKEATFRTKREIQLLRQLHHAHLIKPIAVDTSPEPRWYVMPLMRKGALASNAAQFKGDFPAVMSGMVQIAGALAAMHEHEAVHRDVKPGNIFLGENGDWILGDPGVAYAPDGEEETTTRPVSKDWFPRWYEDELGHSPHADVYMLAATAIYLLTGKKPLDPSYMQPGRLHLPTLFPEVRGVEGVHDFLSGLFVADPKTITAMDGRSLAALAIEVVSTLEGNALEEELRQLRRQLAEPRLVFTFGMVASSPHSGDHPGVHMVPVWLPSGTSRLLIALRSDRSESALYAVEFWDEKKKIIDSGLLKNGQNEVIVERDLGARWYSLRVRSDNGWGSGLISSLVVHALGGKL